MALRAGAPLEIIPIDARQHGGDRQGVASSKVARMDARALSARASMRRSAPGIFHLIVIGL